MLHSPVKMKMSGSSLSSNVVYVITKLPDTPNEMANFVGKKVKTARDIQDALFNQKKLSTMLKDSEIKVSFVDTSRALGFDRKVKDMMDKAIRSTVRGCVLPLMSLEDCPVAPSTVMSTLNTANATNQKPQTITCNFPQKSIEFKVSEIRISFELDSPLPSSLKALAFVESETFPVSQKWTDRYLVWMTRDNFDSRVFKHQNLSLFVAISDDKFGVVFPVSNTCGVLSLLNRNESDFYSRLLGFNKTEATLPQGIKDSIDSNVSDFKLSEVDVKGFDQKYQGNWLEDWMIPENVEPRKCASRTSSKMFRDLQRAYLPQPPLQVKSKEMLLEKRMTQRRRSSREDDKKMLSRGAAMMRLGNERAELRRASLEDKITQNGVKADEVFSSKKKDYCLKFDNYLADKPSLIETLMELQIQLLKNKDCDEVELCALADVTVNAILKKLQSDGQKKQTVEDLIERSFLVNPQTISKRKTSLEISGRIRDHKLQVLYRMELHWLLPSQDKQRRMEDEILAHLRQISIWQSPEEMVKFLNDSVTRNYYQQSSDLLCVLFEELQQPLPSQLRAAIFSPSKSDVSSVAPSSVLSHASELSYKSMRSSAAGVQPVSNSLGRVKRMKTRPTSFDSSRIQIKVNPSGVIKQEKPVERPKKSPAKRVNRAKRNLKFDEVPVVRRSPRKRCRLSSGNDRTPKKRRVAEETPQKLTPGKNHRMFAPETPRNKTPKRGRKTDGVKTVAESPDVELHKQSKVTPRRMAASLSLRRKTSFYSGDVSRNLMKAEEAMNVSKIQNFSKKLSEDSNNSNRRESAQHQLFPHLVNAKDSPLKEEKIIPTRKLLFDDLASTPPKRLPLPQTESEPKRRKVALTPLTSKFAVAHPAFARSPSPSKPEAEADLDDIQPLPPDEQPSIAPAKSPEPMKTPKKLPKLSPPALALCVKSKEIKNHQSGLERVSSSRLDDDSEKTALTDQKTVQEQSCSRRTRKSLIFDNPTEDVEAKSRKRLQEPKRIEKSSLSRSRQETGANDQMSSDSC